jgi:hypothetical protein
MPPVPILNHINPVHAFSFYFLKILLVLSSNLRLGLPSGLIPSGFPTKALYEPLLSPIRATSLASLILIDLINRIIFGEDYSSIKHLVK